MFDAYVNAERCCSAVWSMLKTIFKVTVHKKKYEITFIFGFLVYLIFPSS